MNASDIAILMETMLEAATRHIVDERKMSCSDINELCGRLRAKVRCYGDDSEERLILNLAATGLIVVEARILSQHEQEAKGGRIR